MTGMGWICSASFAFSFQDKYSVLRTNFGPIPVSGAAPRGPILMNF